MNVDKVLVGMGLLILVFLLLSRAGATNSIINAIGGFVSNQTAVLQGVTTPGNPNATLIGSATGGSGLFGQ